DAPGSRGRSCALDQPAPTTPSEITSPKEEMMLASGKRRRSIQRLGMNQIPVEINHPGRDARPSKLAGARARRHAQPRPKRRIGEDLFDAIGEETRSAPGNEVAGSSI